MRRVKTYSWLAVTGLVLAAAIAPAASASKAGIQTRADNPLTTSFTHRGRVDVDVAALPYNQVENPSGRFVVEGLPADAAIEQALLYLSDWGSAGAVSGTFASGEYGPAGPISSDAGDPHHTLTLSSYRFDVTPLITGNGSYPYTSSGVSEAYGSALVVVYGSPSLPVGAVWINDGGESMCCGVTATTILQRGTGWASSGRLVIFTQADDPSTSGEEIRFNGDVVGGPIDENLGKAASLFNIPVVVTPSAFPISIYTPEDWFGWHLAVLVQTR